MPSGMKRIFQGKLTDIHSADKEGVGSHRIEGDNEYIYLKGLASTVAGTLVSYNKSYATALLLKGATKFFPFVAVAKAAIVASKYGWYQIAGVGSVMAAPSSSANVRCYTSKSNSGILSTTSSTNTPIDGIMLTAGNSGSSAAATACVMRYPAVVPA